MVTNLSVICGPSIHVNMLELCLPGPPTARQLGAYKHVIDLLAVHIEEIRISLCGRYVGNVIHVFHTRDGLEFLDRRDECELIVVAGGNDASIAIYFQNFGDE
jgi:hypothetical protein